VTHPSGLYLTGHEHIVTHNSTVIAKLSTDARAEGKRVVLLAHRGELLDQMAEAVAAVEPGGEPVGVVAGRRNDPGTAIVAASFQTLSRPKRLSQLGPRDVILADEAHHITADTYRKVLVELGALENIDKSTGEVLSPALARTAGFTATMYRADGKHLGDVWSHVVYEQDVLWAIDNGFLVAPRGKVIRIDGLNKLASIKSQHGDYRATELNDVMAASVPTTVETVIRHASGRAPIIFAVSVAHAHMIAGELSNRGFSAEAITGNMARDNRSEVYSAFRDGKVSAMVTVAVLTEGADFPRCDTVVMARPTRSQVLYCFDEDTELLTPSGWAGVHQIGRDTLVAAADPHTPGVLRWEPVLDSVHRMVDIGGGEQMVTLDHPEINFRVTDTHRMIWAPWAPESPPEWQVSPAGELVERMTPTVFPVSGTMSRFDGLATVMSDGALVDGPAGRKMARVMGALTAMVAADPGHASENEVISDDPDVSRELVGVLGEAGVGCRVNTETVRSRFGRRVPSVTADIDEGHPAVRWWEENIRSNLSDSCLYYTTMGAFGVQEWAEFLNAFAITSGQAPEVPGMPGGYVFEIHDPRIAQWMSAMSAIRGWSCELNADYPHNGNTALWITKRTECLVDFSFHGNRRSRAPTLTRSPAKEGERVWCVQVLSSAVLTRRAGKTAVLGNCQMLGRSLRPYPGKTDALVIDLTGSSRDKSMVTLSQLHPSSKSVVLDERGNEVDEAEEAPTGERGPRQERIGTADLEDIDLLRRSPANWLKTPAGVRFLDVRSAFIFIWPPNPSPTDQCMLGRVEPNSRKFEWLNDPSGNPITSNLTDAASAAEWFADHVYHSLTRVTAAWRKKTAPSEAQISYAQALGILDASRKTRARLSDDISTAKASRSIPVPAGWTPSST
jgi:superfamily II DNA or RNA helicase